MYSGSESEPKSGGAYVHYLLCAVSGNLNLCMRWASRSVASTWVSGHIETAIADSEAYGSVGFVWVGSVKGISAGGGSSQMTILAVTDRKTTSFKIDRHPCE